MPLARLAPVRRLSRRLAPVLLFVLVGSAAACRVRNSTGELTPPDGAPAWEASYRFTFDDDYTPEPVNLQGRAPHDVRDQRLLAARLGLSHVIAQVEVLQVWGKGRYQGRQDQYLEVEIEQFLMGSVIKGTADRQLLLVRAEDELPGSLQGQSLLLFLRWAPGSKPAYHHHLMPVESTAMAYIAALIEHAKAEGVLDEQGVPVGDSRRGRKRRKKRGESESKPAEGAGGE
ncbi:MAG: hypothetical protein KDK70_34770 [Myxococcales bacterium]|nr:hypothetical protein [Myxococcales bacterium]